MHPPELTWSMNRTDSATGSAVERRDWRSCCSSTRAQPSRFVFAAPQLVLLTVVREPQEHLDGAEEMLNEFHEKQKQRASSADGCQHSSDSDEALVEEPPRAKKKIQHASSATDGSSGKRKQMKKH